jgi:hypothetical protein
LSNEEHYFIGVWFSAEESHFDKFSNYFITKAEWQDLQINKILNDD